MEHPAHRDALPVRQPVQGEGDAASERSRTRWRRSRSSPCPSLAALPAALAAGAALLAGPRTAPMRRCAVLDERRATAAGRPDVLSMLIGLQHADGTGMSDEQLRDEVMTLFSPATRRSPKGSPDLHLLALHRKRMRAPTPRSATSSATVCPRPSTPLPGFRERVFAESMRLYPPVWAFGRRATGTARWAVIGCARARSSSGASGSCIATRGITPILAVRSRAFRSRGAGVATALLLLPVRRRSAAVHREGFAWLEGVLVLATVLQRYAIRCGRNRRWSRGRC